MGDSARRRIRRGSNLQKLMESKNVIIQLGIATSREDPTVASVNNSLIRMGDSARGQIRQGSMLQELAEADGSTRNGYIRVELAFSRRNPTRTSVNPLHVGDSNWVRIRLGSNLQRLADADGG